MSPELEMKLVKKYPRLCRGVKMPITQSCMPFGFEHGDGWYDILDEALGKIEAVAPDTMLFQVKEKYGGLRIYTYGGPEELFDIIEEAEKKSDVTCELCGEPGELRGNSWVRTLCDKCGKDY